MLKSATRDLKFLESLENAKTELALIKAAAMFLQVKFFLISKFFLLTSLDISDVDTVWAWGDKRPPPPSPPGSKYFSEIFSPSHIKLTYNNPNKDFKSVERPY